MPDYSPLPEYIAVRRRSRRPRYETALSVYLRANGLTCRDFAKLIGSNESSVSLWSNGQQLPGLVFAYKIDYATRGMVPVVSWLGTQIGRWTWEGRRGPGGEPDGREPEETSNG